MIYKNINELIPHPKNEYYFDDSDDGSFEILVESLSKSEEKKANNDVLITEDNVIICGHQRVRAAKRLGWKKINCKVVKGLTDEEIEIKLIMDNLSQRGAKGLNELKLGRCIDKLCEYFGFERGNNQHNSAERIGNNFRSSLGKFTTKKELLNSFKLGERTANNYQSLAKNSVEELESAVLSGKINATNATKISRLPEEQQKEVVEAINALDKTTGKKIDEVIESIKNKRLLVEPLKVVVKQAEEEKIQDEKQNEDTVIVDDIKSYFKYGDGSDYEKEKVEMLEEYISNPRNSLYFLEMFDFDYICGQLKKYADKFQSGTLPLSEVQQFRDDIEGYVDDMRWNLNDFENILEGVMTLEEIVERIIDYADDDVVTGCDDDGFLYNEAGKKIGQISNYKNNKLIYDYVKEDADDEGVFYAYDKNDEKIGNVIWFKMEKC